MQSQFSSQRISLSFVILMAMLMSFNALSIDAMMPALGEIGADLGVTNPNDVQLVISSVFLGMALGIVFFGPFSDSFGRKKAIYLGMGIFLIGCLASIFAPTFDMMLIGRVLQGFGAAACRIGTICMIRDRFEGNTMARVMSFIMIIFILTPALAPALGQGVLLFSEWRAIFVVMLVLGLACLLWLGLGQAETLAEENRHAFTLRIIWKGFKETLKNRVSRGYTVTSGIIFGAFIGYLSSAQQILQEQYALGQLFALVFGVLALSIGVSSYLNSRWVYKYGMEKLCRASLITIVALSTIFLPICLFFDGHPPLAALMTYLLLTFFCFGLLFGNLNTMAIQPLGHIAGTASSVIGAVQTLISVALGGSIGYAYDGTVTPMVMGFFVLSIAAMILVFRLTRVRNSAKLTQAPQ